MTLRVTFDTKYVGVQAVVGEHDTPVGMLVGVGEMQLTLGAGGLVELRLSERISWLWDPLAGELPHEFGVAPGAGVHV